MAAVRPGAAREQAQPGSLLLVVHDFVARSADELSLARGDRIELIERDDDFGDGWFLGRHMGNGNTGLFPEVYTTPAPKGTLQQAHVHRPVAQSPDRSSFAPSLQQRPSSSGQLPPTTFAQANLRSSLPTSSSTTPRLPQISADSPVMHETLSVINEHITDLNGSRGAALNSEDARTSRSSVYSSQLMNRFSYIPGQETDEDESNLHTEDEVMAWSPDRVAEYLEDHGVEKMHCDVFKDQEISGEVLLAMDQSSLFIKEFQLGPVGRRLKTWHKIKALQDEVKRVAPPIEPVRSISQYSDGSLEPVTEGARNRSSTIGTILPRALDTAAARQSIEAGKTNNGNSTYLGNLNRASVSTGPTHGVTSPARPDSSYRPSAHSIRTMNSRRHSSIDSTAENIGRTAHRKQQSMDSSWQQGQPVRPSHRHAPSAEAIPDLLPRSSLAADSKANEVDKGYFSSTELETSRARPKRANVLQKPPSISVSPMTSGRTSQPSSLQNTPISATMGETSSASASTTSVNNWSNAVHSFGSKLGNLRSVTTPLPKPVSKTQEPVNPIVTKLEPGKPGEPVDTSTTTSPTSAGLGFFGSHRAKIMGLRATSDAVTREEKAGFLSFGDRTPAAVKEDVGSPTRTGSTTPSTETRSFDLPKSDINSRASTGSGGKLAPPVPTSRRPRHKTKKDTSAYTRGLEQKTPVDAMADCDYSGWMKKKSGSLMTTWKTRLFILKGRRLSYYYRDDDTEEKGLIDISFHRVLPAHNETLTGVHAAVTGAIRGAPSPKETPTKTAAQKDLEEHPPASGEEDSVFIFKLVPPKVGLSKAVNFTKPTVHYFAVNSRQEGRLWMAALMKATIDRDDDAAVTTTYNQKTISLAKARARQERPPALREEGAETLPSQLEVANFADLGLGIGGIGTQSIVQSPTKSTGSKEVPHSFLFEDGASSITASTVAPTETDDGEAPSEGPKEAES